MLVESAKSAIRRIEKLMKKMNEGSIDLDEPIEIEEYLTRKIMTAKNDC
jgi:exonuclease VII small subunit